MSANGGNSTRTSFDLDSSIKDIATYYEKLSHCIGNSNVCADLLSGHTTKLRGSARKQSTGAGRHK
jgi:hypothetical protein